MVSACPIFRSGISQTTRALYPKRRVIALETMESAIGASDLRAGGGVLIFADTNRPDKPFLQFNLLTAARDLANQVIALAVSNSVPYARLLHQIGVARVLDLSVSPAQLKDAVDAVERSDAIDPRGKESKPQLSSNGLLSAKENLVLEGICQGLSLKAIALNAHISPKTVSTYKNRVMAKLNVDTNAELLRLGVLIVAVSQYLTSLSAHRSVSRSGGGLRVRS